VPVLEEVFFLVQRAPEVPVLEQLVLFMVLDQPLQVRRAPKVLVLFMVFDQPLQVRRAQVQLAPVLDQLVLNQPPAARTQVQRAPEVQVLDQQVVQEVFSKNLTDLPRICLRKREKTLNAQQNLLSPKTFNQ
jgi:hypothetical protein